MAESQNQPNAWPALLAAADARHAASCRTPNCPGRTEHEQAEGVSYLAGVMAALDTQAVPVVAEEGPVALPVPDPGPSTLGTGSEAVSVDAGGQESGTQIEATTPVPGPAVRAHLIAGCLALATAVTGLAQLVADQPVLAAALPEPWAQVVLLLAQVVLLLGAAYGVRPRR